MKGSSMKLYCFCPTRSKFCLPGRKIHSSGDEQAGFTLTEILVVVVIIGILVLLAMPRFSGILVDVKATEAKIQLRHLHELQQVYYFANDRYATSLNSLRFHQEKTIDAGGPARYRIEIVQADNTSYLAKATAMFDSDQDGEVNIWTIDQTGDLQEINID